MNYWRCLPADAGPELERVRQEKENKIEFYQTRSSDSASYLGSFRTLAIRSKQNIDYGEELYVDYSSLYDSTDRLYKEKQFI